MLITLWSKRMFILFPFHFLQNGMIIAISFYSNSFQAPLHSLQNPLNPTKHSLRVIFSPPWDKFFCFTSRLEFKYQLPISNFVLPFCYLQVTNAVEHVNMGTDALQTAKSLQKKSRKCMMIAIILLLVIALIIVLSILKPWKKW